MKKVFCLFLILATFFSFCFSEEGTAAVKYSKEEFPQWVLDARRTEIITFGSLPFVTLVTTFGYTFYRYCDHGFDSSYAPNPFAKTSDSANLDTDEQKLIMGTSAFICLGLGLTDLCYNLIKRRTKEKNRKAISFSDAIKIIPLENNDEHRFGAERDRRSAYMYGGMKSAVF